MLDSRWIDAHPKLLVQKHEPSVIGPVEGESSQPTPIGVEEKPAMIPFKSLIITRKQPDWDKKIESNLPRRSERLKEKYSKNNTTPSSMTNYLRVHMVNSFLGMTDTQPILDSTVPKINELNAVMKGLYGERWTDAANT